MARMTDHLGRPVVAVTGIGVVTSLGVGKADNWAALTAGRSGIHPITRFPTDHLNTRICRHGRFPAVELQGRQPADLRARRDRRRARRSAEAGLDRRRFRRAAFPRLAAGRARLARPLRALRRRQATGTAADRRARRGARAEVARDLRDRAVRHHRRPAGRRFGTRGLPITLSTACASGATAIQLGVEAIRRGECDRALSIGADGSVDRRGADPLLAAVGALDPERRRRKRPPSPSRSDRDGFVIAEGAAALVLESLESAHRARRQRARHPARLRREGRRFPPHPLQAGRLAGDRGGARRACRCRPRRRRDRLRQRARHLDAGKRQDGASVAVDRVRRAHAQRSRSRRTSR